MATLEELTVVLDADTRPWMRELDRATRATQREFTRFAEVASRSGRRGGTSFITGFAEQAARTQRVVQRSVERPLQEAQKVAAASGGRAGSSFVSGFTRPVQTMTLKVSQALDPTMTATVKRLGEGGAQAGQKWVDEVGRTVRDARPRFAAAAAQAGAGFSSGLQQATQSTSRTLSAQLGDAGQRGGQGFTSGLSGGLAGVAGAFAPVAAAAVGMSSVVGGAVLRVAGDFDHAMAAVRAVTGATGEEFTRLESLAKEMGATTMFSATEAAQAMEFLGMAGWDTTQIMAGLPDVLNLAAAGGLGLAEAADIASNIMAGMSMEASEVGRAADALATAAANANVDVRMLGETASYAAGTAASAGWSIEQLALATGLFGNVGIQGSTAGTALNHILNQLQNSSSKAADLFAQLGIEIRDSSGAVRDFDELLIDLMDSEVTSTQLIEAFGQEHGPKLVSVLQQGEGAVRKLAEAMDNTSGEADRMASIRMDSFVGALDQAKSAAEGFFIAIADLGILDTARDIVDAFSAAVSVATTWLEKHADTIRPVIRFVSLLVASIAAVVGVFLAAKAAIAGVGAVFAVVTSPIGLVIGAIGLLIAGLVKLWQKSETFRDIVTAAWDYIADAVGAVVDWFKDTVWPVLVEGWEEIKKAAGPHIKRIVAWLKTLRDGADSLGERWGWLWDAITAPIRTARTIITTWASNVVQAFKGWVDVIAGLLEGDWERAWEGAKEVLAAVWDTMVEVAKAGLKLLWTSLKTWFLELPRAIGEWLVEVAPVIWDKATNEWIPAFVDWVVEMGRKFAAKLGEWLDDFSTWLTEDVPDEIEKNLPEWTAEFVKWAGGLWGEVRRKLTEFATRFGRWIVSQAQALPGRLSTWSEKVRQWAGGLWGRVKEKINEFGTRFAGWAEEFAESLPARLQGWTNRIVEWIEGFAESLPGRLEKWTDRFVRWIEEFAESLPERLETLTQKFVDWATGAPEETATAFEDADGPGKIEEQIENDWAPRLIAAFGRALLNLALEIPGMVVKIGWALLSSFARILIALALMAAEKFRHLLGVAARLWEQIKQKIIEKASELVDGVKDKINELYDNTVGRVTDLYNEVVGNSIWPDMVDAIIGETGRLSKGVGDKFSGMGRGTTGETSSMAQTVTRQVQQLRAAVVAAVAAMQASVARLIGLLARGFTSAFTQLGAQALRSFRGMAAGLVAETSNLVRVLNRAFSQFGSNTVRGFANTVRGVASAWAKLRQAAAAPVRYVISPVYNKGLRPVWNRVAARVSGLSPMSAMSVPSGLAEGGVVPGYQPSKRDDLIMGMRSGEGVLVPEVVKGLGAGFIDFWNRIGNRGGVSAVRRVSQEMNKAGLGQAPMEGLSKYAGSVPGLARGGIVGRAQQFTSTPWRHIEGRIEAKAKPALDEMHTGLGKLFGRGDTFNGIAHAAMGTIKPRVLAAFRRADEAFRALMGGGLDSWGDLATASERIRRTAKFLTAQRGKPYIWGGVGPGGYDCSGLTSAAENVFRGLYPYRRRHTTHSFLGAPPPGWVRGLRAPLSVGVTHAGVGHMAGTLAGVNFESRGSRGVVLGRAARGTRSFPHQFGFAPSLGDALPAKSYDQGGWLMPGYTLAYNGTGRPEPVNAEPIRIILDIEGGDDELRRRIRRMVRIEGGGDVQVAFGSGRGRR